MEAAFRPGIGETGRGDDDDEEALGADGKRREKEPWQGWGEGDYHRLDQAQHGMFAELWQRHFEKPESDDEQEEDDDEEEDDEEERAERAKQDQTEPEHSSATETGVHDSASAQPDEMPAVRTALEPSEPPARPPQPHQASVENHTGKPPHQAEDDKAFEDIMASTMDQDFHKATSGDVLTAQQPGTEAPAIENTHNQNVSLEPELADTASRYDTSQDRLHEGLDSAPAPRTAAPGEPVFAGRFFDRQPSSGEVEGLDAQPVPGGVIPPQLAGRPPGEHGRRIDRIEHSSKRLRNAVMIMAVVGYFANKHRKQENRRQDREMSALKQSQRDTVEQTAAVQYDMQQRLAQQDAFRQRPAQEAQRPPQPQEHAPLRAPERQGVAPPVPNAAADSGGESAGRAPSVEDAREAARRAVEQARQTEEAAAAGPQRRVEQDAWRRYVVDKQGHEVQNVIAYGEEYTHEREHEALDDRHMPGTARPRAPSPHARDQGVMIGGVPQPSHSSHAQGAGHPGQQAAIDSGLTPPDHSLPAGMPAPADWQHQLPEKKRNPVLAALTSPWLFLMLSLILLAYFIASLL